MEVRTGKTAFSLQEYLNVMRNENTEIIVSSEIDREDAIKKIKLVASTMGMTLTEEIILSRLALSDNPQIFQVISSEDNNKYIIVNGVKYVEKKQNNKKENLIDAIFSYNDQYFRKLDENIDIVLEFGLIQNKESKLSRWERNAVVHEFNRLYEIAENYEVD